MIVEMLELIPIEEAKEIISQMFSGIQEWVYEREGNRILFMTEDGHVPTTYELSQIDSDYWDWLKKLNGWNAFSESLLARIQMLEDFRSSSMENQDQHHM